MHTEIQPKTRKKLIIVPTSLLIIYLTMVLLMGWSVSEHSRALVAVTAFISVVGLTGLFFDKDGL